MLACVCQPMETALLFNGGPPVTMGPLGANGKMRNNRPDLMKNIQLLGSNQVFNTDAKDNLIPINSAPSFMDSSGSLLNLRKIERKTKSTKILVNPVCLDGVSSSDDSNRSKSAIIKWNGKKKRLKPAKDNKDENDRHDSEFQNRDEAKKDKRTVSCFKIKGSDEKEHQEIIKESYANKNADLSKNCTKPDIINHTKKHNSDSSIDKTNMNDNEEALNISLNVKKDDVGAVSQREVSF